MFRYFIAFSSHYWLFWNEGFELRQWKWKDVLFCSSSFHFFSSDLTKKWKVSWGNFSSLSRRGEVPMATWQTPLAWYPSLALIFMKIVFPWQKAQMRLVLFRTCSSWCAYRMPCVWEIKNWYSDPKWPKKISTDSGWQWTTQDGSGGFNMIWDFSSERP